MKAHIGVVAVALACLGACDGRTSGDDDAPRLTPRNRPRARAYSAAEVLGRIRDPALIEISGIAASRAVDGAYWVHNDSGNPPEIACVMDDGMSCGTVVVLGATNLDWEDVAADGDGHLYIADIGDNLRQRASVTVYRIPEPTPPGAGTSEMSQPSEAIELTYPNGARDAEALLVHPETRAIYIVTKAPAGLVYRAGPRGGPLRLVGKLELPGLFSLPTAGDISPDGEHALIGTYGTAFELNITDVGDFDTIWRRKPRQIGLPIAEQREAIAYRSDGRAIVSTTEGRRPPLIERQLSRG